MKTALITGASGKLGAALAQHLAREGYLLALHYHAGEAAARELLKSVTQLGCPGADIFQADLSKEADILRMRDAIQAHLGPVTLLINNAGVYHETPFLGLTEAQWFAELNSTATAVYFTTRAFLPMLRETRGRVINLGDGACDRPGARTMAPAYHIGKTGVYILTRSFAQSEAPHGVAVNMVSPGLLETSVGLGSPEVVPAGRFGTFSDIISAVDFLISANTSYLTGSNLIVGGGWNL